MAVRIECVNHKTKYYAPLAAAMRGDDKREAIAALGMGGASALYMSMYCSQEVYVAVDNETDAPLCAFGVCRANEINAIWFIASERIEQHKRELLTLSRKILGILVDKYGKLENMVDIRSRKSVRFIKWLGFTINPEIIAAGANGEFFYHFYKERSVGRCVPLPYRLPERF